MKLDWLDECWIDNENKRVLEDSLWKNWQLRIQCGHFNVEPNWSSLIDIDSWTRHIEWDEEHEKNTHWLLLASNIAHANVMNWWEHQNILFFNPASWFQWNDKDSLRILHEMYEGELNTDKFKHLHPDWHWSKELLELIDNSRIASQQVIGASWIKKILSIEKTTMNIR